MGVNYKGKKGKTVADEAIPVADHHTESKSIALPSGGIVDEFKSIVGSTFVKHKDGAQESKSEEVAVAKVEKLHANVGVKMARTINTGNYESSKIEVSLHAPADMNEDDINATFDFAVSWIDAKMNELVTKYTG